MPKFLSEVDVALAGVDGPLDAFELRGVPSGPAKVIAGTKTRKHPDFVVEVFFSQIQRRLWDATLLGFFLGFTLAGLALPAFARVTLFRSPNAPK